MHNVRTVALFALLLTTVSQISLAQKKPSNSKSQVESLTSFVEKHFARWDRDRNDSLDLVEVDHVIEDHAVHGRQAALVVLIRHHMTDHHTSEKGRHPSLSQKQLLTLVDEHEFVKSVQNSAKHLESIDRELFLPNDPNLTTFQQGRLNDCYLLSPIAAQSHRSPKAIRNMIHPEVTGGFQVVFGDGQKIYVTPLTEGELLLGAKLDHRHGSWLAVLEKAYGVIRKRELANKGANAAQSSGTEPFETLNFGNSGTIISLLTGHHADSHKLEKASDLEPVHNLLIHTTKNKRLVCVSKNKDKGPPGIVSNHAYAILDYDARGRQVTVFNPWGNNFSPKGPQGKANGYATKNGVFTVPLPEFHAIFSNVMYETDKPLAK